ncbi:MAG: hypothetical protein WDW36_007309 [Sanguina aurantia]
MVQDDRRPSRGGGAGGGGGKGKGGKSKKGPAVQDEEEEADDETTEEFLGGGSVVSTDAPPPPPPAQAGSRSTGVSTHRSDEKVIYNIYSSSSISNLDPEFRDAAFRDASRDESRGVPRGDSRGGSNRDSSSGGSGGGSEYQRSGQSAGGGGASYVGREERSGQPMRTREENIAYFNGGRSASTKPQPAGGDRPAGGGGGRGPAGQEPFRGQRIYMTEEQLAKREESSVAVKGARTWREIANVLRERSGALDSEHISTMLTKVWDQNEKPTDPDSVQEYEALVGALYGWVAQLLPQCRPVNTSSIIYSISKLQYFNAELVAALVQRALEQKGNFAIRDFGMMMAAFGSLGHNPGPEFMAAVYRALSGKIALREASPFDIATVLGALVKFGATPTQEWLDSIATVAASMNRRLDDIQWGTVVYTLAALGYNGGDGAWLATMTAQQGRRCGFLYAERLNKVTWALTQYPHRASAEFLDEVLASWVTKMRGTNGQMLSAISYNLAYLQVAPGTTAVPMLIKCLDAKRSDLSGDELANIIMTLAIWNHKPESRWVDELAILVRTKLPTCTMDGLTKVQSSLALLGNGYRLKQVRAVAVARARGVARPVGVPGGVEVCLAVAELVVAEAGQYALQLQEAAAAAQADAEAQYAQQQQQEGQEGQEASYAAEGAYEQAPEEAVSYVQ